METETQTRSCYPFFPSNDGLLFFSKKRKNRWFCNRPLSPPVSSTSKKLKNVIVRNDEDNLDNLSSSSISNADDSDKDPNYIPELNTDNSDEDTSYITDSCTDDSDKGPTYILEDYVDDSNEDPTCSHESFKGSLDQLLCTKNNTSKLTTDQTHSYIINKDPQSTSTEENNARKDEPCLTENVTNKSSDPVQDEMITTTTTFERNANKKTKKIERIKDFCYFCETEVLNFARHIKRNHPHETEVSKIFSKRVKCKERRDLLTVLRKKGNYLLNSQECLKPVKRAVLPDRSYLPCTNCLGFYSSKFLYRHRKKCLGKSAFRNSQAEGQNLLLKHIKVDLRLKEEVFPRMRADKISLEAKKDFLICAFGARYLKTHRERHFINVTSRKMRELSRILIEVRKLETTISNMYDALQPKYYDLLVEATKSVAKYDRSKDLFLAPTFAMNISTSLKQCCDIAIHMIIKQSSTVQTANHEASLRTMINLLTSNWRFDISSRAGNDLNINKFNKVTIIPLASDMKLLKQYLISKAEKALVQLKQNARDVNAYNTLLETIFCRVILLNRRRPGELQRMLLHTYKNTVSSNSYEEFNEAVTETEKMLLKKFKRVVIRGKRGRGVPVMFTSDTQDHIEKLLEVRPNFMGDENPYLFGKPMLTTPIYGYKILAKYAVAYGAKNAKAITCTRLRKHLATLTQLFNLTENEIEQLATFMGHTPGVHKNSYRLPDDIYQTAKISKLLLLMERGKAGEYKGKKLNDIELNLEEDLLNEDDKDSDEEDEEVNQDESLNFIDNNIQETASICINNSDPVPSMIPKKKRNLVPWTEEQKKVVVEYFKKHIKKNKPPRKQECEDLLNQYPDVLFNKSWLKIKVFVQNKYTSKKMKK